MADYSAAKKRYLFASYLACVTFTGLLSPVDKSAEISGFWGPFWKLSNALGPLSFGWIAYRSQSLRTALLGTLVFFLAGFLGMFLVDEKRGREQSLQEETTAPRLD